MGPIDSSLGWMKTLSPTRARRPGYGTTTTYLNCVTSYLLFGGWVVSIIEQRVKAGDGDSRNRQTTSKYVDLSNFKNVNEVIPTGLLRSFLKGTVESVVYCGIEGAEER